jgi:magnesium transporter
VRIYKLKREIAEMRRAVIPLKEPMRQLSEGSVEGINDQARPFFADVYDHVARTAEVIDGLDNLLTAAFQGHLARISVQQNEDMRKIAAGVALAASWERCGSSSRSPAGSEQSPSRALAGVRLRAR